MSSLQDIAFREFPGGPVVRIPGSQCFDQGSIPGQATEIPQATWCGQKKRWNSIQNEGQSRDERVCGGVTETRGSEEKRRLDKLYTSTWKKSVSLLRLEVTNKKIQNRMQNFQISRRKCV